MPTPGLLYQGSSVKALGKRGALGQIFPVELDCVTMARRPERSRQDWEMVSGPVLPAPGVGAGPSRLAACCGAGIEHSGQHRAKFVVRHSKAIKIAHG